MNNIIKKILIPITLILFICFLSDNVTCTNAHAKSNSIIIKDTGEATVKELDKCLKKGKSLVLKVKGSDKNADKTISALQKHIQKTNGAGVVFQFTKGSKSGAYCTYNISADNAKMYNYTIKFINKLYKKTISGIKSRNGYTTGLADRAVYPDNDERYLRIIYDNVIKNINEFRTDYKWVYDDALGESVKVPVESLFGADPITTLSDMHYIDIKGYDYCKNAVIIKEWTEDYVDMYQVKSFEEFKNSVNIKKLRKMIYVNDITDAESILLNNRFGDLSDAMKIYAIDASKYFDCRFKRGKDFGMVYSFNKQVYKQGSAAMKLLLNNKAIGVCATYSYYEKVLFEQLGIETYTNTSWKINHGWTVVKVKNSAEKTLWIPFDYGIGPSPTLAVSKEQKKYINTEKKRYKLYLLGIKGAPKKRNFTTEDFR